MRSSEIRLTERQYEEITKSTNLRQRISELKSIIEGQQQELEYARSRLNAQEIESFDPSNTIESCHRIDQL